jgi:Flp pilus assembly protein TadD
MDPVNPLFNASLGMILYLARQFGQAVKELHKALEIDSSHFLLHFRLGLVYSQMKMFREAVAEMRKAVELSGTSTEALTGLAQAYAAAGKRTEMAAILHGLKKKSRDRYVSAYNVARVYGALQDKENALAWLEKAYEEHNPDLIEVKMDPVFDCLLPDSRFVRLLSRIGFTLNRF